MTQSNCYLLGISLWKGHTHQNRSLQAFFWIWLEFLTWKNSLVALTHNTQHIIVLVSQFGEDHEPFSYFSIHLNSWNLDDQTCDAISSFHHLSKQPNIEILQSEFQSWMFCFLTKRPLESASSYYQNIFIWLSSIYIE